MNSGAPLLRLLQLASPMLPVGAYSYSQGLEWAVEAETVRDAESAARWIEDTLRYSVGRFEAPVMLRMQRAWDAHDVARVAQWNARFAAARECAEFRAETLQMGYSLVRLLREIKDSDDARWSELETLQPVSFPAAYSCAAALWHVPHDAALCAYVWAWAENQVSVAMKTVPLGQVAGQKILSALTAIVPTVVSAALALDDDMLSNFAPLLAIAGSKHETQYSRLFRS